MKIAEIGINYCLKEYGGNAKAMIQAGDALIYDNDRIRKAFNFGNGSDKDMLKYIKDNRKFALFYDLENHCFC